MESYKPFVLSEFDGLVCSCATKEMQCFDKLSRAAKLLRPWKQQRQQLGPAFAIDDSVDEVGPEPALEGNHCLLRIGNVITEPFERQ